MQTTGTREASIRVMTWNIRHGLGNDDRVDLGRIAAVIQESGADVVGLQEVDRGGTRSGRIDQAAWLGQHLGMSAHFAPNATFDPGDDVHPPHHYGVAILSRHPVLAVTHRLLVNDFGWEQRGALAVSVSAGDGTPVTVVNTHLQWAGDDKEDACSRQRAEQVGEVLALARESGHPAIVMGDFNAGPGSPDLAVIEAADSGMVDAWRAIHRTEPGHTFPSHPHREAVKRIDFLFASSDLRVEGAGIHDTPGSRMASDHYPLLATIAVTGR